MPSLLAASDVLGTAWFGATDIVTERGDGGVARIKDLTGGLGRRAVNLLPLSDVR